ncbi:alkylation response protein AidB-like acyl-CoA dehydrogenase [Ilumatobacter fluminis]|uniref:Alkylation response protein AidB-like acyl-CoA dehydrogenase n=1 Tax=Ilumatobacter fluminis TaxID=467091 RepID=A0A4R7I365_9ACTN|nr:acyl-CoA dehydrogenase family protein [Ilumatobacter fluminis]TDT17680.1 alkylation response protein AidB-like acyl-CoA dehydrogenase [Ilumatobacter fluminis]
MDFDMPAEDDPRRLAVREWLEANPDPTNADLHEAGYIVPHWPEPYGLNADPMHQLIIDDELKRGGVVRTSSSTNAIGVGWAAPTIYLAGSDWQKERFLPKIFSGDEIWCQLFSEPDAGSDLANLGTRAVRDGDEYIINGSKIWTSGGHHSQYGILIARTDPDVPKHKGISYFIVPMDLPGIELQPIVDMTTAHSFNQTFFDNVRLPAKYLVGNEGDGWRLAKVTLANERVSLSSAGSLWGVGPSADQLLDLVRQNGGLDDPIARQRFAQLHIEAEVLRLSRLRTLSARLQGKTPGVEASIQKVIGDEQGQVVMELAKSLAGADGMIAGSGPSGDLPSGSTGGPTEVNFTRETSHYPDVEPIWHYGYLFAPALTLGGGTFAVQRNIIAEQVLGLPRDINVEQGLTWSESRRTRS